MNTKKLFSPELGRHSWQNQLIVIGLTMISGLIVSLAFSGYLSGNFLWALGNSLASGKLSGISVFDACQQFFVENSFLQEVMPQIIMIILAFFFGDKGPEVSLRSSPYLAKKRNQAPEKPHDNYSVFQVISKYLSGSLGLVNIKWMLRPVAHCSCGT